MIRLKLSWDCKILYWSVLMDFFSKKKNFTCAKDVTRDGIDMQFLSTTHRQNRYFDDRIGETTH